MHHRPLELEVKWRAERRHDPPSHPMREPLKSKESHAGVPPSVPGSGTRLREQWARSGSGCAARPRPDTPAHRAQKVWRGSYPQGRPLGRPRSPARLPHRRMFVHQIAPCLGEERGFCAAKCYEARPFQSQMELARTAARLGRTRHHGRAGLCERVRGWLQPRHTAPRCWRIAPLVARLPPHG